MQRRAGDVLNAPSTARDAQVGVVHGAELIPQLPNTTVVMPRHDDGCIVASQVAWPS